MSDLLRSIAYRGLKNTGTTLKNIVLLPTLPNRMAKNYLEKSGFNRDNLNEIAFFSTIIIGLVGGLASAVAVYYFNLLPSYLSSLAGLTVLPVVATSHLTISLVPTAMGVATKNAVKKGWSWLKEGDRAIHNTPKPAILPKPHKIDRDGTKHYRLEMEVIASTKAQASPESLRRDYAQPHVHAPKMLSLYRSPDILGNRGKPIFTAKAGSIAELLQKAVRDGVELIGVDLHGQSLTDLNLRGAMLVGADLRGADLSGSDLSFADLSNVNAAELPKSAQHDSFRLSWGKNSLRTCFEGVTLDGTVLDGGDFTRANLWNATGKGVSARGAQFIESLLISAKIDGLDLSFANLRDANFGLAQLQKVFLAGTDIYQAETQPQNLEKIAQRPSMPMRPLDVTTRAVVNGLAESPLAALAIATEIAIKSGVIKEHMPPELEKILLQTSAGTMVVQGAAKLLQSGSGHGLDRWIGLGLAAWGIWNMNQRGMLPKQPEIEAALANIRALVTPAPAIVTPQQTGVVNSTPWA